MREIWHKPPRRSELPLATEGTEGQIGFPNSEVQGRVLGNGGSHSCGSSHSCLVLAGRLLLTEESGAAPVQGLS